MILSLYRQGKLPASGRCSATRCGTSPTTSRSSGACCSSSPRRSPRSGRRRSARSCASSWPRLWSSSSVHRGLPAGRGRRPQSSRVHAVHRVHRRPPPRWAPGLAALQRGRPNPLPWLAELRTSACEQNFFEGRVTEYQQAAVAGRSSPTRSSRTHALRLPRDPAVTSSSSARPHCRARSVPTIDVGRRARRVRDARRPALTTACSADRSSTWPTSSRARCRRSRSPTARPGGQHGRRPRHGRARPPPPSRGGWQDAPPDHRPRPLPRSWRPCSYRGAGQVRHRLACSCSDSRPGAAVARARRRRLIRRIGRRRGMGPAQDRGRHPHRVPVAGGGSAPAGGLAARVDERARGLGLLYVPIETVQDIVQEELVLGGHMRVAERYIVYRAERALLRARSAARRLAPVPLEARPRQWSGDDLRGASRSRRRARPGDGRGRARAGAAPVHPRGHARRGPAAARRAQREGARDATASCRGSPGASS